MTNSLEPSAEAWQDHGPSTYGPRLAATSAFKARAHCFRSPPWGPPHDSSQSVQNEFDFDGFCEVSGRPSKNSFSGSGVRAAKKSGLRPQLRRFWVVSPVSGANSVQGSMFFWGAPSPRQKLHDFCAKTQPNSTQVCKSSSELQGNDAKITF